MKDYRANNEALKSLGILTEEDLRRLGFRKISFDGTPYIEDDDFDEYIKRNGYLTQEEYNNWLNNLLK